MNKKRITKEVNEVTQAKKEHKTQNIAEVKRPAN